MRMTRAYGLTAATALLALAGALTAGTAQAAARGEALTEARAQYQRDVAFCRSGRSEQSMQNCMKEAAAAYDEAKWKARGRAESPRATNQPDPSVADPQGRATSCHQLSGPAHAACLALLGRTS